MHAPSNHIRSIITFYEIAYEPLSRILLSIRRISFNLAFLPITIFPSILRLKKLNRIRIVSNLRFLTLYFLPRQGEKNSSRNSSSRVEKNVDEQIQRVFHHGQKFLPPFAFRRNVRNVGRTRVSSSMALKFKERNISFIA